MTVDRKEKAKLVDLKRQHKTYIERDSYYNRIARAIIHPDEYLSIIIDGQHDNRIPHHPFPPSKDADSAWKLPVHCMGALVHGRQAYAYVLNDSMKQGNNVTIEVLHRVLLQTLKREGKLPRVLYLQLENTTKQCKGRGVLGYLATLVELCVFDKSVLSFLPVGHTHEDIDQMFSCFAKTIAKLPAFTRAELGGHEKILHQPAICT